MTPSKYIQNHKHPCFSYHHFSPVQTPCLVLLHFCEATVFIQDEWAINPPPYPSASVTVTPEHAWEHEKWARLPSGLSRSSSYIFPPQSPLFLLPHQAASHLHALRVPQVSKGLFPHSLRPLARRHMLSEVFLTPPHTAVPHVLPWLQPQPPLYSPFLILHTLQQSLAKPLGTLFIFSNYTPWG